jgi:hypothetical protein
MTRGVPSAYESPAVALLNVAQRRAAANATNGNLEFELIDIDNGSGLSTSPADRHGSPGRRISRMALLRVILMVIAAAIAAKTANVPSWPKYASSTPPSRGPSGAASPAISTTEL